MEGYKWNELGKLYQYFIDTYAHLSLNELLILIAKNVYDITNMLTHMTEDELFKQHQRKWVDDATKTTTWEVYKFIHVTTVAPFTIFKSKIRKWKKITFGNSDSSS